MRKGNLIWKATCLKRVWRLWSGECCLTGNSTLQIFNQFCLKYDVVAHCSSARHNFTLKGGWVSLSHESHTQLYWHVSIFRTRSLFIGKKVEKGDRQIHGCSASPRIPTQTLRFLGRNRMPELLWDVVSPWGLWNSWFSADRDRHWSPIIPSERNVCRTAPAWSSRLDSWASWRRTRWFRGFSGFGPPKGLEAVKATELPRLLSGLLQTNKWPWAVVRTGETRIHQWRQIGTSAATPESSYSARSTAICVSQETEDRWGKKSDIFSGWVSVNCHVPPRLTEFNNGSTVLLLFAVSPERSYGIKNIEWMCSPGIQHGCRHTEIPFSSFAQNLRTSKFAMLFNISDLMLFKPVFNLLLGMLRVPSL